jgi:hypothetical protein
MDRRVPNGAIELEGLLGQHNKIPPLPPQSIKPAALASTFSPKKSSNDKGKTNTGN